MLVTLDHRTAKAFRFLFLAALTSLFAHGSYAAERIRLIPASQLADLPVRSSDGAEAGRIEYVMIDAASARVRYVVIAKGGDLVLEEKELVALPFDKLDFNNNNEEEINISVDLKKLREAPPVAESAINQLANPIISDKLYEYYLTPESERVEARGDSTGNGAAPTASADDENGSATADRIEDNVFPQVLVTRDAITTTVPGQHNTGGVFGADVTSSMDEDYGEIDELMIDVKNGIVAYALIDHGGYLGIGEEWYAVPLQQLNWTTFDEAYLVSAPAKPSKRIPKTELPTSVRVRDLAAFYENFPLTDAPYGKVDTEDQHQR